MEQDRPVQTAMRASLNRPQLLMGADRELVLLAGLLCALMAVTVMSFFSFVIAAGMFATVVIALSRIGRADPLMRKVYVRHVRYHDFYPAKSGSRALGKPTGMSWR